MNNVQKPQWGWKQVLLANAMVLVAYFAVGKLSLLLALPPGYATPLFPPAGIALAMTVILGWRILPGVALASFLLDLQISWTGMTIAFPLAALAAGSLTLSVVLQALLGALLFRRYVSPAVDSGRDVVRFLLLAPAVCVVGASGSLGALYALGLLTSDMLAIHWISWWFGDTIGVLLGAPLCWILAGQPRALWWRRRTLVALPLLLSIAAFVAIYEQALKWEHGQHLQTFRLKSQQVGDLLQAQLSEHERFIYALARALGDTQRMLPAPEFANIAHAYLDQRPELKSITWIARVEGAQRARFEAWGRRNVAPDYRIRQRAGDSLEVAPARAVYYPILYVEPDRERYLLGLDLLSEPAHAEAVRRARQAGAPQAGPPLRLIKSPRHGILLLEAVSGADRNSEPFGMLGIALEVESYLRRAIDAANFTGFTADFADVTDPAAPIPMLATIGRALNRDDYRKTLNFGGRSYLLRFAPTPAYLQQQRGWQSWTVLTGGLLLTGLLGALMLLISGEHAQIQAQVDDSTAKLREREARLQAILDNAADAIVTVDRDGTLISGNAATAALFGYPPEKLPGLRFERLLPPGEDENAAQFLHRLARAGPGERELIGWNSKGGVFPLAISVSQVELPGESLFVCILRDLTEQQRSQQHIYRLAHHDTLTGLENRFSLNLRLEQLLAQARRTGQCLAVLFIDLDHFKKINDSYGHQTGDLLLVTAAGRMKELLRDVDAIARLGGDEFIIVMEGALTPAMVSAVAVRVVQSLAAPYLLDGKVAHSGASVGVALFPGDGDDGDTLLRHADTAMYAAKGAGRGNFQFFSPAMNAATHERLMLEERMWVALERNEFELYLQPQVALDSGRVVGAEGLLRWHHRELGMIEPSRFIPIAEESGLIHPLGEWVLRRAVELLAEWQQDGMGKLRLAVNLSARQCHGETLLPYLDRLLAQSRIDPALLELEITETAAMQDPERTRHLLRQLRERRIKVAIDDFGTGYSSLSYLKLFAIDRIKIDRGFVKDIETDPNDAVIVAATIALAHSLGLGVIAEGVETRAQQRFLRDKLGDEAQGYLFAHPMPAKQFRAFIAESVEEE